MNFVDDGSGRLEIPATASYIADIICFRESIRAFYQVNAKNILHELADMSGHSAIIQPASEDSNQFDGIPLVEGQGTVQEQVAAFVQAQDIKND